MNNKRLIALAVLIALGMGSTLLAVADPGDAHMNPQPAVSPNCQANKDAEDAYCKRAADQGRRQCENNYDFCVAMSSNPFYDPPSCRVAYDACVRRWNLFEGACAERAYDRWVQCLNFENDLDVL